MPLAISSEAVMELEIKASDGVDAVDAMGGRVGPPGSRPSLLVRGIDDDETRWKSIRDGPVLHPSMEEMDDFPKYICKHMDLLQNYGIMGIQPPVEWKRPEIGLVDDSVFRVKRQRVPAILEKKLTGDENFFYTLENNITTLRDFENKVKLADKKGFKKDETLQEQEARFFATMRSTEKSTILYGFDVENNKKKRRKKLVRPRSKSAGGKSSSKAGKAKLNQARSSLAATPARASSSPAAAASAPTSSGRANVHQAGPAAVPSVVPTTQGIHGQFNGHRAQPTMSSAPTPPGAYGRVNGAAVPISPALQGVHGRAYGHHPVRKVPPPSFPYPNYGQANVHNAWSTFATAPVALIVNGRVNGPAIPSAPALQGIHDPVNNHQVGPVLPFDSAPQAIHGQVNGQVSGPAPAVNVPAPHGPVNGHLFPREVTARANGNPSRPGASFVASVRSGVLGPASGGPSRSTIPSVGPATVPRGSADIASTASGRRLNGTNGVSNGRARHAHFHDEQEQILDEGNASSSKHGSVLGIKRKRDTRDGPKWHVTNVNEAGLLRHLSFHAGVSHPMFYSGGRFSRFCWHTEDMYLNSISYNHRGGSKVWLGAPPWCAALVEEVCAKQIFMETVEADKGKNRGIRLLQGKTTLIDPLLLLEAGVPVCRIEQKPGMFIVTATRGYHAGFNRSFNIAEAVNYAGVQWFTWGEMANETQREMQEEQIVGFERMLFHEASALFRDAKNRGIEAVRRDKNLVAEAKIMAGCLARVMEKGEAALTKLAKERNWKISSLKDVASAVHCAHACKELQSETKCWECKGRDHFYTAVCGCCTDNPASLCFRHFDKPGLVCRDRSHKMVLVRRHDPDVLLEMLSVLEKVAGINVDPATVVKRFDYLRDRNTPLRKSGLKLKLNLSAARKAQELAENQEVV